MKKLLLIIAILVLTGCTRGQIKSHSSYYIDGDGDYEEECNCNCEDIESDYRYLKQNIEHELQFILNEPEYYSKKNILEVIEKVYDLVDD